MLAFVSLAAAAVALLSEPAPIVIPPALLARTSMPEPSGVVWSSALSRYLVVSDDTGEKQLGNRHAPWLFAMTRAGAMDSEPIPILGLEKLNDAESICAGPAGSFFLATSHSPDRKGHEKAARRLLLQLKLSGRALIILGSLNLAAALESSGAVPPGGLDIEGLAYRDGALYLGLKAPQTAAGAALILRIPNALSAFHSGTLNPNQLERFAEVRLRVPGVQGEVIQGISDMSFMPDGSLILLANSPKRMPPDGGGAVWWLRPGAEPRLLHRFVGLKPEGVTLTEDNKALLIVMDQDQANPHFVLEPIPK